MELTSTAFQHGADIPKRHTCDGLDISPPLSVGDIPDETRCLVIVMTDPDTPHNFVHWLMYDIPVTGDIAEDETSGVFGLNDFGNAEYGGPCPPGGAAHRYVITCYALDKETGLPQGQSRNKVNSAMEGHIIASAELWGAYGR